MLGWVVLPDCVTDSGCGAVTPPAAALTGLGVPPDWGVRFAFFALPFKFDRTVCDRTCALARPPGLLNDILRCELGLWFGQRSPAPHPSKRDFMRCEMAPANAGPG